MTRHYTAYPGDGSPGRPIGRHVVVEHTMLDDCVVAVCDEAAVAGRIAALLQRDADDRSAAIEPNEEQTVRSLSGLRDHGMLWLINRVVFHPRGYALGLVLAEDGTVTGWSMYVEDEPWTYGEPVDEREQFRRAEAFLASLRP